METSEADLGAATAEATRRREKLRASMEAIKDRVEHDVKKVQGAKNAVRERAVRHRWPLMAVAFGFGLAFGRRRKRRYEKIPLSLDNSDERAVLIVRTETAPEKQDSFLGSVGGLILRRAAGAAVDWATDRLEQELTRKQD